MARGEQRGPYAKGVARRAEILRVALEEYGKADRQGASLKQIADSVGLTEAGVLHYFDSKDDMLLSVLAARDRVAEETFDLDSWDGIYDALRRTYETPGQVTLFVEMMAAAMNPAHPAHDFMTTRNAELQARLQQLIGPAADDGWLPRILVAVVEGLQLQWLRDGDVDVVADTQRLIETPVKSARRRPHATKATAKAEAPKPDRPSSRSTSRPARTAS